MNETLTTATTASNRVGITSLILAFLAGVFLCLAEFSIGPARIMLLSLPAGVLSLGAVISCIPCEDETHARQLAERIARRKIRRGYRFSAG